MKKRDVNVGSVSEENRGRQFVEAWSRTENGDSSERQERVYIADVATLAKVLSEKRIEVLRCVRRHPNLSIRALSKELQRDYSNVHADVSLLKGVGLIEDANGLVVPYTRIRAAIDLEDEPRQSARNE